MAGNASVPTSGNIPSATNSGASDSNGVTKNRGAAVAIPISLEARPKANIGRAVSDHISGTPQKDGFNTKSAAESISGGSGSPLSPEATAFKPAKPDDHGVPLIVDSNAQRAHMRTGPIYDNHKSGQSKPTDFADHGEVRNPPPANQGTKDKDTIFTTDPQSGDGPKLGHYAKLSGLPRGTFATEFSRLCSEFGWKEKLRGQYVFWSDGTELAAYLCFDDARDMYQAFIDVETLHLSPAKLEYIGQVEYAEACDNRGAGRFGTQSGSEFFDGQIVIEATYNGAIRKPQVAAILPVIFRIANEYGTVQAFSVGDEQPPTVSVRIEYHAISAAKRAAREGCRPQPFEEWTIVVHEMSTERLPKSPERVRAIVPILDTPQNGTKPSQFYEASPIGRSTWFIDEHGRLVSMLPANQLVRSTSTTVGQAGASMVANTANIPGPNAHYPFPHANIADGHGQRFITAQSSSHGDNSNGTCDPFMPEGWHGEAQHVLRWKIAQGHDVRTTIMLRNLPNHLTFRGLKMILDEVSFGKYDFSYLRIDFAENKNVGYGFVNFTDPTHLIDFIDHWGNRKWCPDVKDRFGKVRDARFSYATVQGYDCLVEKFRNSAVMDEFRDYRPKLWYTFETAPDPSLVGTEINFPPPNNWSKKQRSIDNASHIGLYTSQNRNGRRGRYSQFDRGTSAQIREDAFLNQNITLSGTHFCNDYRAMGFGTTHPLHGGYGPIFPYTSPQYGGLVYGNGGSQVLAATPLVFGGPIQHYDPLNGASFNGSYGPPNPHVRNFSVGGPVIDSVARGAPNTPTRGYHSRNGSSTEDYGSPYDQYGTIGQGSRGAGSGNHGTRRRHYRY